MKCDRAAGARALPAGSDATSRARGLPAGRNRVAARTGSHSASTRAEPSRRDRAASAAPPAGFARVATRPGHPAAGAASTAGFARGATRPGHPAGSDGEIRNATVLVVAPVPRQATPLVRARAAAHVVDREVTLTRRGAGERDEARPEGERPARH